MSARANASPTPFKMAAPAVVAAGYRVLPIMPDSKSPGTCSMGQWRPMLEWQQHRDKPLGPFDIKCWSGWPEANIGVLLGSEVEPGRIVIALDFDSDDPEILDRIERAVPPSTVTKRGRRGFTAFYSAPSDTRSRRFKRGGETIFEILSAGKQTVIPPSIHPDTKEAYRWMKAGTLATVNAGDLVRLSEDDLERLIDSVEAIEGVKAGDENRAPIQRRADGDGDPYRNLNDAALERLDDWVPQLGLPRCKRTSAGYSAVPPWRENRKGLAIAARGLALGFSDKGIRDFSADEGHTPVNVVMRAEGLDHHTAYMWLAQRLGMWIDDDGEWAELSAPKPSQAVTIALPDHDPETGEVVEEAAAEAPADPAPKPRSPLLQWFGATAPTSPRWLVDGILPEKGVAILAGQHGAGKTYVGLDLAAAVVTGGEFAEAQVRRQGGVLWLAAEGEGEVDARMLAILHGKLKPPAPAPSVSDWMASHNGKPRTMAGLHPDMPAPSPWPFARQVRDVPRLTEKDALPRLRALTTAAASEMATYFNGAPLSLIVLDTLSAAAGFEDENSASETQRVMNMLAALSRETGALVLVVDHFGKAAETGVRGSSAKGAAADAILAVLAERSPTGTVSDRRMAVTKLRGGVTGAVRSFELRETAIDEWGASNCFVQWTAPKDAGEAEDGEVKAEADTGRALLRAIYDKPAGSHAEWAAAIGKSKGLIGKKLTALKAEKLVDKTLDTWSLTPKGQIEALRHG